MIREDIVDALRHAQLDPAMIEDLVERTLAEDLDGGVDATSVATIPADQRATLDFVSRAPGTLAGVWVGAVVFDHLGCDVSVLRRDGDRIVPGDAVLTASGFTRSLLLGERTALNLMSHLSGVATATSRWVDAIAGTSARVRDTRKTTPGMRSLEKFAVRCGGGVNHRMSLSDAALVKDNHVLAAGGVAEAFRRVREQFPACIARSRSTRSRNCARLSMPVRTSSCSITSPLTRCVRPFPSQPVAPSSRHRADSRSTWPRPSRQQASTTSQSAL